MPELPEVEMVRRQLADKIIGKTITSVEVHAAKSVGEDQDFAEALVGQKITALERKGKYLFFTLSGDDSFLVGHLRMTGRIIFVSADSAEEYGGGHSLSKSVESQPHKYTRIILTFQDGSHLYYNDMRKFGYLKRATAKEVARQKKALGREPLAADYTLDHFTEILADRRTTVKAALLKQSDIAGLGNIYVDEACWRSEVRPDRAAGELTDEELEKLFVATRSVLKDALEYGGTTFRDYVDTKGDQGNFTDKLAVFGREGQECPRCGSIIKKSRVAGRGTHICPGCQR
ncbi:MAG: bifunctional DNA-formamidopyrimidine glycosylase/DNA-(apurinic or apyrimidinic site) lyase [Candidatus Paceibacterota bacterium]